MITSGMITHIAFDIGGVILKVDQDKNKKALLEIIKTKTGTSYNQTHLQSIVDEIMPLWFAEADSGLNLISKYFSKDKSASIISDFVSLHKKLCPIDTDMIKLCQNLSQKYQVGIISNLAKDFISPNNTIYRYKFFKPIIYSGNVSCRKPDPKIFEIFCQKANCQFDNLLFIDDSARIVNAGKDMGITSLLFTTQAQLEKDLNQLNLL